jgi:hypothetical protein
MHLHEFLAAMSSIVLVLDLCSISLDLAEELRVLAYFTSGA